MLHVTRNEKKAELDSNFVGNLTINSISNKFDQQKLFVRGKVGILVITETKLDSTFPFSEFLIEGYSEPYRFYGNRNGGG